MNYIMISNICGVMNMITNAIATVAIGNPERHVHRASHRGSKQQ